MKKTTRRRGIFVLTEDEPETDEEMTDLLMQSSDEQEDPETIVRAYLDRIDALCKSTNVTQPGSKDMLRQMRPLARNVRHKLEQGRDPWSIAFHAMSLARLHRNWEANESLMQPLAYASKIRQQHDNARVLANRANVETARAADQRALDNFVSWRNRLTQLQPLNTQALVRQYISKARASRRTKDRVRKLFDAGRIPPQ